MRPAHPEVPAGPPAAGPPAAGVIGGELVGAAAVTATIASVAVGAVVEFIATASASAAPEAARPTRASARTVYIRSITSSSSSSSEETGPSGLPALGRNFAVGIPSSSSSPSSYAASPPRFAGKALPAVRTSPVARTDLKDRVAALPGRPAGDAAAARTVPAAFSARQLIPAGAPLGDISRERAVRDRQRGGRVDEHCAPQARAAAAGSAGRGVAPVAALRQPVLKRQVLQRQGAGRRGIR